MKRDEVAIKDLITVRGYGGLAEVLAINELPYLGMYGQPIYTVTIKWGPNNNTIGRTKYSPVEEFPLGRCEATSATIAATAHNRMDQIDSMDEAALMARLAELKAKVG